MVVFNQFCGLLLGIYLLAFVQCARESCTLQEFKQSNMFDEHYDLSNLVASYPLGKSVRVPCQVGYRGFFRLVCSDLGWTSHGNICKKILCGHPGDVQFADFQLVRGTDYDFGSQVRYTCHLGYQMTSYTSTRTCLVGGWDGHLPECEPIPCPSLTVENNVIVYGDMDQATSGSVIQFSCSSADHMLEGPTQIICGDTGNWDKEEKPRCRAISCAVPPLDHFEVEGEKTEYKNKEFLTYNCIYGYKKMDGRPSQCKKVGNLPQWTPMPRCEPKTCKLSSNAPEETKYNPQNKIIFRVGENVTVSCGEKHWVKSIEHQSAKLTCLEEKEDWDFQPLCQPVTCSKYDERVKHIYSWQRTRFNTLKMDEALTYQCQRNYFETSPTATCTRRGWEPDPLCKEILCPKPPPQNFTVHGQKTLYKNNEVLSYTCDHTYKKVDQRPPKCQKYRHSSQWIPTPYCEPKTCKLSSYPPEETKYNPQDQTIFRPGQTVNVSCGEKHWVKSKELQSAELTCLEEKEDWDSTPVCQLVKCLKDAEHVIYWGSSWSTFSLDETVTYQCDADHVEERLKATCTRGGWEPKPLCKEISCLKPPSQTFTVEEDKAEYTNNEVLKYSCISGYRKVDQRDPLCHKMGRSSGWTPMPQCEPITCKLEPHEETTFNPQNQIIFTPGDTVTVSCGENHWVKSTELQSAELTCLEDKEDWDFEPVCKPVTCSKRDAAFTESQYYTRSNTVSINDTWEYRCEAGYVSTSLIATCTRRGWQPHPLCKEIFCQTPQLQNFVVEEEKTEYKKGDDFRYTCDNNYRKVDTSPSRCTIVGRSPQWDPPPRCEPKTCELVPSEEATYTPQNKTIFSPGETVAVLCGENHWVNSTCREDTGTWDSEPVCKPITCSTYDGLHVYSWQRSTTTVKLGETLWYYCHTNYVRTSRTGTATCTGQGWDPNPLCYYRYQ